MSNFGDQASLATDRPPDGRGIEDFPKTKSILWDKTPIGKPTFLHLGYFRKPRVCIPEKVLKLVQHQCENYGQKSHTLIGSLIVEDDGEGVQFQVDRLDTRPIQSADMSAHLAPGDLLIPLEVTNNTASKRRGNVDDFVAALRRLQERCCSKLSIDLSSFVLLRGWVSFYSNAHSSVAHMDFDMVTMGTVFKASPIANVSIVLTALSKNLAGPMSLSHTQGMPKSGYLTMDHARKLLLVLESDPKAGTLPIVGIWVSGVDFVQHSFVWAACLRYIHSTHLQDRVCAPPEEFLLVLYSPLHSRPEFFQCSTTTGNSKLSYELWCGHEVGNQTKSLSSQCDDFTEVELGPEQNFEEKALFDAAQAKHSAFLSSGHLEKNWTEDINPRSIPTPHTDSLPVIKPMVPDVSILWTDSPNNTAFSSSVVSSVAPAPPLPRQTLNANMRPPSSVIAFQSPSVPSLSHNFISQERSHVSSVSKGDSPKFYSSASNERGQFYQPYFSQAQSPHTLQTNPSSFNVVNHSARALNNQSDSPSPHSNTKNTIPVYQNLYKQPSPRCDTQNQAILHSNYPPLSHSSRWHYQETHPEPRSESIKVCTNVQTPQHAHNVIFDKSQNCMVLASKANNDTHLTTSNIMNTSNQQYLIGKQTPVHAFPESRQVQSGHQTSVYSVQPQQVNPMFGGSPTVVHDQRSQALVTGMPHHLLPPNTIHAPLPRNQIACVNTLKTVVEENSSSSSCDGCSCQQEKNMSVNNESSTAKMLETNASINRSNSNSTGNTTKSSDDDSGLSVTPERPSSSPTPKASGLQTNACNMSHEKSNIAFGEAMSCVNWEQVPPEIRTLLIQQNEQLKLLQQQIQILMTNQNKSPATDVDSATSNIPSPSTETKTKASCSVAVNTSFSNDHQHTFQAHSSQHDKCSPQRPHSSSTDMMENHEKDKEQAICDTFPTEVSQRVSNPVNNGSSNRETKCSSLENSLHSCKSLPQTHTGFDAEVAKDSRASLSAANISEFEPNRSQFDPSYPNDSDFFNNCQDESYSTVAEDATDPRQFYDQIMNNIHMFLTNGEDSDTPAVDQTSLAMHDSDLKFPDSANSTSLPHINYMSMMLGASSDTGQSMEINAMAMKYLKDDQLTQMAMMLKQSGESDTPSSTKLLQRMISSGSSKKSSSEISHLGISPNNLTMGTRNYLEKHGLLGNDSQCFNDYSMLDHTLKLNTDFSVAMTDRESDMSTGNIKSVDTSPMKSYRKTEFAQGRKNVASSTSPMSDTTDHKDNQRQHNNSKGNVFPKDLGASPVLMPPKHYNSTQSPGPHIAQRKPLKGQGRVLVDYTHDDADDENILDIAKLKQLPKLL